MSKKSRNKIKTNVEIIQGIRRDWGEVNPVTKIIPDKRRKPPKYKNYRDDD